MTNADGSFSWKSIGALATLLIALFVITGYLTDDKIASKVQQHAIAAEAIRQKDIVEIKERVSAIDARQQMIIEQNKEILREVRRNGNQDH